MTFTEWTKFAPKPKDLTPPDEWNVFLSYRSVDRTWVLNLYDVLRQHGYKVFLDQCVLKPGDALAVELGNALENSQTGILVWSDYTRDSDWVMAEYGVLAGQAIGKPGFRFVPVTLDDSKLPPFAKARIYVSFSSYPDGPNGGELLRLLHGLAGEPLSDEAAIFADAQDVAAKAVTNKIKAAIFNKDDVHLVELFEKGGLAWQTSSALGCQAADGLIKLDRTDQAIEMLEKIQQQFPRAIRPKQLHALALRRRGKEGDLRAAQRILGELYTSGERDPETLGIFASTWMDRYEKSGDEDDLLRSRDLYADAFEWAKDDYYTGINAAAKSVFIGKDQDISKAADYAERVQKIVGTTAQPGDYWKTATVAETFLIQRKYEDAGRLYKAAVSGAPGETGSHKSTWKQACRLMNKLQPTAEERALIREAFKKLPDCENLKRT